jgi:hypothetical protein
METPMQQSYTPDSQLVARVDAWSNWLLIIVVLIPFIISFGALKELAAKNGVNYPFMYPLMIDLSLIIFNLSALRSSLYGERNRYAWSLVIMATVISVALNMVHAPRILLAMFMAGLPPLFILAAFHLVVVRIEQSAKHSRSMTSLTQLRQKIEETRAEHEQLLSQRETAVRDVTAQREQLAVIRKEKAAVQHELERLRHERSNMQPQRANEQSMEASISGRRERLQTLLADSSGQMTQVELAQILGVSVSTIRRDLQSLNGQGAA